jgi:hypothetical protein
MTASDRNKQVEDEEDKMASLPLDLLSQQQQQQQRESEQQHQGGKESTIKKNISQH